MNLYIQRSGGIIGTFDPFPLEPLVLGGGIVTGSSFLTTADVNACVEDLACYMRNVVCTIWGEVEKGVHIP